ncbi:MULTISPECIES: SWF or SNF family helicase [unclassified Streptomyces]|uniref:SWIM zinc finger family protein n=1 Tax=unclassified Streptomyces TaxID=2593676 RepID=UPI000DB9EBCD|nr:MULTISPECIES: SWF or SNF family helicase [unclassified Streptomyces]MYT75593.1 SWF or SNF family helicase [Streptomyces sp. SID8367]RAJ86999.1 putative Zn finger protein [Streptomyces sp. PsTaAH-137]
MSDLYDDQDAFGEGREAGDAQERVFAALPPAQGRGFAATWWGQAWLKALEDTALDLSQLKAGRRLARAGAVGAVSVRPGRITAVVRDRGGALHRSDVLLHQLDGDDWDRLLGMAVERSGHIAALLDREMPPHLVEDAAAAGVELLPGIGDLEPRCDCDAWDHCAHTSALSYQVARLLDQDPFVLLLLRGRDERSLLDELQVRSAAAAAPAPAERESGEPGGVDAADAYASAIVLPPLPPPPLLPAEPGLPPVLDTETAPPGDTDVDALEFLGAQAAAEAHRLLSDALTTGHPQRPVAEELSPSADAARLAAAAPPEHVAVRLARASGRDREGLALAARAWEHGGVAALAVLEDAWTPDARSAARARAALEAAWEEDERPVLKGARGRWTLSDGATQLRLGRDGRWWPYRKERGRWAPAGPAASDPAAALVTALGTGQA